ncbi:hypothetical protein Mp_8g16730 [Marchantia polymorpha subsp. ruderalis]|uniref:Uncharacterized protein n=1 Tax=Marchantia polymorpha TaxID=3197 RepID=A0A2R6X828_MARPO|nr:hypothetical protein MARPO_0030s0006 [Marchantia polymorpha]BBN20136.1 hypothetical protein Mp_8g16730 [Marchantia polymorpha subsp. ruderalis]PTQ42251.1 hypothetical protein MARPO_0030s0006 [Marchantia polymorpha]PTQ42252.1 hypothetical protein MARPO_0030s0006 [Marchantia polymorpha]BBN20137.1 hypothetical protein Mp_8g16730 [Marchantia polymorpha subsp. ruderalis]|eukprot:PTQ42250.1 hypothetical protein MARPO_0030s0006 [Marchantia polymorpha]
MASSSNSASLNLNEEAKAPPTLHQVYICTGCRMGWHSSYMFLPEVEDVDNIAGLWHTKCTIPCSCHHKTYCKKFHSVTFCRIDLRLVSEDTLPKV